MTNMNVLSASLNIGASGTMLVTHDKFSSMTFTSRSLCIIEREVERLRNHTAPSQIDKVVLYRRNKLHGFHEIPFHSQFQEAGLHNL